MLGLQQARNGDLLSVRVLNVRNLDYVVPRWLDRILIDDKYNETCRKHTIHKVALNELNRNRTEN